MGAVPDGRGEHPPAWAVVVAAGSGTRFGERKQFARLGGRSVLGRSLASAAAACAAVVVVVPAVEVDRVAGDVADLVGDLHRPVSVVAGGARRSDSVRAGLAAVPDDVEVVAVHDAARPLAGADVWARVLGAVAAGADAAIPVVPVTDTIKQVGAAGRLRTLDRSSLVAVQTPQAFRAAVLREAHAAGGDASDDAALVEALGARVVLVDGGLGNLKITTPGDLLVAEALLGDRR